MKDHNDRYISKAVIRRLPRYFRYLRELLSNDIMRISSKELSERMNVTASQIRQDLNCFGGFGDSKDMDTMLNTCTAKYQKYSELTVVLRLLLSE